MPAEELAIFCGDDMTDCKHNWEPIKLMIKAGLDGTIEAVKTPYWYNDKAIGVDVVCSKCKRDGIQLWTNSGHARIVRGRKTT